MIHLAQSDTEISACFPVLRQLRPHLTENTFVPLARELMDEGYQFAYLKQDDNVVCVAGFKIAKNLYLGKHLYIEDLSTDEQVRSQGFGTRMMAGLMDLAKRHGCQAVHLDSGVHRHAAHKFYLNQDMKITSYHFVLETS